MENLPEQHRHDGQSSLNFLTGLVTGALAGAATMLLLAPQSGRQTREQIQRTGVDLRDQATEAIEDTMVEARRTGRRLSAGVQNQSAKIQQQADKMQKRGQEMLDGQKERWAPVGEAGQKAVNGTD